MENFQKTNKRTGLNKRAGWNISRKINKRPDLNKGTGRDDELNTMRFLVNGYACFFRPVAGYFSEVRPRPILPQSYL